MLTGQKHGDTRIWIKNLRFTEGLKAIEIRFNFLYFMKMESDVFTITDQLVHMIGTTMAKR